MNGYIRDASEQAAVPRVSGDTRDAQSTVRDADATAADLASIARDAAALTRDDVSISHDGATSADHSDVWSARYWALRDRSSAASDRLLAANNRAHSQSDRFDAAADRYLAGIDQLTGAYRRDFGLIQIARSLGIARKAGQLMIIGFVDVDGLKRINDQHGHAAGDTALQSVAMALRAAMRPTDITVRYGGDEFVFSITDAPELDCFDRIDEVNNTLHAAGTNTVTYGLVTVLATETVSAAIKRADHLLYEQKSPPTAT